MEMISKTEDQPSLSLRFGQDEVEIDGQSIKSIMERDNLAMTADVRAA